MFGFRKTLDIITLFHKANTPASTRAVNLLKQASTSASQAANEASSTAREPFDLDITEKLPTADQVETILEYVGKSEIPQVVSGANSVSEALRRFKMDKESFQRPVVVDWSNGKVAIGAEESKILKMLQGTKE